MITVGAGTLLPWGDVAADKKTREDARTQHAPLDEQNRAGERTPGLATWFSLTNHHSSCGGSAIAAGGSARRSRPMHDKHDSETRTEANSDESVPAAGLVHFVHFGGFGGSERDNRRTAPRLSPLVHFVHFVLGGESYVASVCARLGARIKLPPLRDSGERSERDRPTLAPSGENPVHFRKIAEVNEVNGSKRPRRAGR